MKVYADSSVYGGAFDEEFAEASKTFFDQVRLGRFDLVVSPVIADELSRAPERVRILLDELRYAAQLVEVSEEVVRLQEAYLRAGIVGPRWEADALHVSLATVSDCRLIVSWNFRHIVHFQKIPLYNRVNVANGYGPLGIHTPPEVIVDED